MPRIKVSNAADMADGTILPVEADGQNLLLIQANGTIHATARKCPHMGADLGKGSVTGSTVVCPKHGAAFELVDGVPCAPAKVLFLKMTPKPLATYPVTIEGDDILVSIG